MSNLFSTELFDKVLIDPLNKNADKLCIVSGYATATMVIRHLEYAKRINKELSIDLIIGMSVQDGIERNNHKSLIELQSSKYNIDFNCFYVINRPPIHSKVYTWLKQDLPFIGFVGSANYTQNGFSNSIREVLCEEDADECYSYFKGIKGEVINCEDQRVNEYIEIFDRKIIDKKEIIENSSEIESALNFDVSELNLDSVKLSLLDKKTGEVPLRSGLNWGQRNGREPNQAYLNIPSKIGSNGFFPERFEVFTVITDDDKHLICVRAQENGKGIHTTLNNSHMGEYFRYRLGLKNGQFITKAHLLNYGRSDVSFYKIDDENYFMDFSVK